MSPGFSTSLKALLFCLAASGAEAGMWDLDPRSKLGFSAWIVSADSNDKFLDARIPHWSANIDFDPDHPENAKITVSIRMATIESGDASFDQSMRGANWLGAADYPEARIDIAGVEPTGDAYRAMGLLTLKGREAAVPIRFRLTKEGDQVRAVGTSQVARLAHGVGKGTGTELAAPLIDVSFDILARPRP